LLENTDIYNTSILELINLIINQYNFDKPRPTILKKWVVNLDNPNGLDVVSELKKIDIWLGEKPVRAKKWKRDWRKRIQGWLTRTIRPSDGEEYTKKPYKRFDGVFAQPVQEDVKNKAFEPFIHVCNNWCPAPCWMRDLTLKHANGVTNV